MFELSGVTREEGFPLRTSSSPATRSARGRSMTDIRWYQTLALWKSIVFMEGNYKRAVVGRDRRPVPQVLRRRRHPARRARRGAGPWRLSAGPARRLRRRPDRRTSSAPSAPSARPRASTRRRPRRFPRRPRRARALLFEFELGHDRRGRLRAALRPRRSAWPTARAHRPALRRRARPTRRCRRRARRCARAACAPAWSRTRGAPAATTRDLLAELFDGVVISGEEGFRKPDPRIYALGARADRPAAGRVRVRRRPGVNLDPARELGMASCTTRRRRDARGARGAGGLGGGSRCAARRKKHHRGKAPAGSSVVDWCCRTTRIDHRGRLCGQEPHKRPWSGQLTRRRTTARGRAAPGPLPLGDAVRAARYLSQGQRSPGPRLRRPTRACARRRRRRCRASDARRRAGRRGRGSRRAGSG